MNIHKHLRSLFLISTALFWVNCSNDTDISSPKNDTEGLSNSLSDIESSSSKESGQEQASSAQETTPSKDSHTEQDSTAAKSSPSQGTQAKSSSSSDELKVYRLINDFELIPDSCEPNRFGWHPNRDNLMRLMSEGFARAKIEQMLSLDSSSAISISKKSKECLKSMLDTLSSGVYLYGTSPWVTLDAKCSDGSIYYSSQVKEYAKLEGLSEEEAIQEFEKHEKEYNEKEMEEMQKIDNCFDSSEKPTGILCYSDIAQNASGDSFDIIECDDGKKYLSHRIEDSNEKPLPEGVQNEVPLPTDLYATNCFIDRNECQYGETLIAQGNVASIKKCDYIIRCPSSDQAESSSSKQAKSSSSSKEPEEKSSSSAKNEPNSSSATYGGEFAKK